jgi:hypothetical protein
MNPSSSNISLRGRISKSHSGTSSTSMVENISSVMQAEGNPPEDTLGTEQSSEGVTPVEAGGGCFAVGVVLCNLLSPSSPSVAHHADSPEAE